MSYPDEHRLFLGDLADRRRERDHQREPGYRGLLPRDHGIQRRLARHTEMIGAAPGSIVALECPVCLGSVYAPRDSNGERVDCDGDDCHAQLVTLQTDDGLVAVLPAEVTP